MNVNCIKQTVFILLLCSQKVSAQDNICNTWLTEEGTSKVRIFLATDGKYYGQIEWLKDTLYKGRPLIDTENPDKSKRGKPWLGLRILSGLTKKSKSEYVGGKIYDPTKGNYYSCKMTIENTKLVLRGYVLGLPFLGKSTTWSLSEE